MEEILIECEAGMGPTTLQDVSTNPLVATDSWPSLIPRYLALTSLLTSRKRITAEGAEGQG